MSLRFILGRAGAGKTRLCLDEIRQRLRQAPDGPPLVFLVPEQATFQTEHALALTPGLPGIMRAYVLSFRRLAWRVFSEVGGAARPHIGELGKQMLLSRILEERRRELSVFGRAARQFGFAGTVARALSELKTYLVTPEDLERAGGLLAGRSGAGSLAGKVRDLRLVYKEFEARLAGRYVDPDDYLTLLAAQLEHSRTLAGGEVWVDGFAGFTPQEFRVLQGLLRAAGRVSVALCVDPSHDREAEAGLFHVTGETHARLAELARHGGIALERPVRLGERQRPRFKNSPGIAHLEREFFRRPAAVYSGDAGLTLAAAANRRAEVESAAREIRRLCRERGYRWREVSVVVRDLENYHELLAIGFADYGIPCFIDRKRLVLHHPLVEFIRAALEVVYTDWAYDPVFRWLKTDLAPVSREEVDLLENYVLAHGIRGAKWTDDQDWPYLSAATLEAGAPDEAERRWLARVNGIRRRAARRLREFQERVAAPGNVRELTASLYDLVAGSDVPEQIARWSREAEQEGLLDIAREHR
ncbi:MAG: helicase-exonuclease AddAB subunit AddB, partial [Candidatus Desulforudis sp.]|nr:helicase-exonuclease AddAB subunit AddB [Desulforudis sp.]